MELNPETPLAEPSLAVLEIRARMAQLDKTDDIVVAVTSMLKAVGQKPVGGW
jgi:hypothetical protein